MLDVHIQRHADPNTVKNARAWLNNLGEKGHKWAARYTWSSLSMGVDSTQRSEAINAAIKGFLTATTLLTRLIPELDNYAKKKMDLKVTRDLRLLVQRSKQSGTNPILAGLEKKVTEHALKLMEGQSAQMLPYRVVPTGDNETFWVTFTDGTAAMDSDGEASSDSDNAEDSKDAASDSDDEEQSKEANNDTDNEAENVPPTNKSSSAYLNEKDMRMNADNHTFGLPTSFIRERTHKTTLKSCSCQFPTHFGIPCRHMFRLYLHTQTPRLPVDVIHPIWHKPRKEAVATGAVANEVACESEEVPRGKRKTATHRKDYYNLTMSRCKCLAELSKTSDSMYQAVVSGIDHLCYSLSARLQPTSKTDSEGESSDDDEEDAAARAFDCIPGTQPDIIASGNPVVPRGKGRPRQKRYKSVNDTSRKR